MNVLLIGSGRWGEKHLRVLRELGATVWVAELSPARREVALRHGVPPDRVVGDYRDALGLVDAVDLVTPADSHREIAGVCLAAGRHCFVEKPLALTSIEGRELALAADQAGLVLQVGHILRFHPVTGAVSAALEAHSIGEVRYATGRISGFKRPRSDVGITHTDAIHYFDLFAYLFAHEPTNVLSYQRDYLRRGLDDMSVTIVNYGAVAAVVETNYFMPGKQRECVIIGESGSLVADFDLGSVVRYTAEHRRRGDTWEAIDVGRDRIPAIGAEPLRAELEAFLAACAGRAPVAVSALDGVRALEIVEAAAQSARLGRAIPLVAHALSEAA
jgi:UDP-2-acetamido-3-amino-2,3-dideoxy-glucuronate N-acetyltransferase